MNRFDSVEEALEELRNGKIILVTDDPDRENEGDFICAAEFATTENINFMATHGKMCIRDRLWSYDEETGNVVIRAAKLFHEYTVSFLAYIMWDPVHMYNAVVNDWKDVEPQITFDVRQPKTKAYSLERLRRFLDTHEYVDVVRFTTFFHQFTLIFDELAREKYVDWFGYSASVSPYILEQFEKMCIRDSVK